MRALKAVQNEHEKIPFGGVILSCLRHCMQDVLFRKLNVPDSIGKCLYSRFCCCEFFLMKIMFFFFLLCLAINRRKEY